jgi:DNA-binding transcriptional LysR family regulator
MVFLGRMDHNLPHGLRHLRYFVAVAEKLHFSRAAEDLNISTPNLSNQIRALETMLGAQLLSRKTKSAVALTQTDRRFLEEARATLRHAEMAELIGKRAARDDVGSIVVGYILWRGGKVVKDVDLKLK